MRKFHFPGDYPPHLFHLRDKYLNQEGVVLITLPGGMYGKIQLEEEILLVKRHKKSPRFHKGDSVRIVALELSDLVVAKIA